MKIKLSQEVSAKEVYDLIDELKPKGKVILKDNAVAVKSLWLDTLVKVKSDTLRISNRGNVLSKILAFIVFLMFVSKDALGIPAGVLFSAGGFMMFIFVCSLIANIARHASLSKRIRTAVKEKYQ